MLFAILCRNATDPAGWPRELTERQSEWLKRNGRSSETRLELEGESFPASFFLLESGSKGGARKDVEQSPAAIDGCWTNVEVAAFADCWPERSSRPPAGIPAISVVAMPADLNPGGAVFGGWLLAQMDQAAGIAAWRRAGGRCVSVSMEAEFSRPIMPGDHVSLYASIESVGRSSMRVSIEGWRRARTEETSEPVGHGAFVFVSVGDDGRARRLDTESAGI